MQKLRRILFYYYLNLTESVNWIKTMYYVAIPNKFADKLGNNVLNRICIVLI